MDQLRQGSIKVYFDTIPVSSSNSEGGGEHNNSSSGTSSSGTSNTSVKLFSLSSGLTARIWWA